VCRGESFALTTSQTLHPGRVPASVSQTPTRSTSLRLDIHEVKWGKALCADCARIIFPSWVTQFVEWIALNGCWITREVIGSYNIVFLSFQSLSNHTFDQVEAPTCKIDGLILSVNGEALVIK
jgi:hypothetical protein